MGNILGRVPSVDVDHRFAWFDRHTDRQRCDWRLGRCEGIEIKLSGV